jgi:transmembrane protein TMEM260 (protein O-mannosyltransferase)
MRQHAARPLDRAPAVLVVLVLGAAYARTLAPGVTWANDGADSGDLAAAAATLGVAHPTGYPTYLLLARLFQLIPLGDLAFRTNLLSATAAIGAALCAYAIVRRLRPSCSWRPAAAAACGALGLGLSPVFWSQAVVAEVYSLNALFAAALLLFALQAAHDARTRSGWPGRLRALVAGLALGNHLTIAVLAAGWLAAVVASAPRQDRARVGAQQIGWVSAGLLVYAYLPLRAAAHPPINWGDPHDWAGFWWVVSGQPYRGLAFGLPSTLLHERLAASAALLGQQYGPTGLALGFYGLLYGKPSARWFVWLSAAAAAGYSAFAITYNTADSYAYLIPVYLIFALWIGMAIDRLLESLERVRWRAAVPLGALALAGLLAWRVPASARRADASQDRRAIDFAAAALSAAPSGAIVLTSSDFDTFPLWYYHYAIGQRPDLFVVVAPLLDFAWYRDNLRAVYPALQVPDRAGDGWEAALVSANPAARAVCRTDPQGARPIACDQRR